jgi:hypothetical protein
MNFIYRSYCNPKLCVETNGKRCCHHCALSQPMLLINLSFRLSQNWTREISLFSPPKGGDQPFPSPLRKSGKFLSLNGFGGGGDYCRENPEPSSPLQIWGGGGTTVRIGGTTVRTTDHVQEGVGTTVTMSYSQIELSDHGFIVESTYEKQGGNREQLKSRIFFSMSLVITIILY